MRRYIFKETKFGTALLQEDGTYIITSYREGNYGKNLEDLMNEEDEK